MEVLNCRFANRVVGGQWESKLVTYIRKYSMSNKSSIVTSAADGCGKPSSIRTMDNLPSRDHKGAEYKESFMFSNRSSVSHGSALAIAAFAAVACIGLASTASASTIIYQDNFGGTSSTPLNGATPTTDNGTSSTWTATTNGTNSSFYDNGSASETSAAGALGYLNFMPVSGYIYTLSATLSLPTSSADTNSNETNWNWFAVGYASSVDTSSGATFNSGSSPNPYAWVQVYAPFDNLGFAGEGFEGPNSSTSGQAFSTPSGQSDTAQQISIVLNTGASTWTYQFFDDGTAVSSVESFSSNPAITAVGLCLQGSPDWSSPVTGNVSNFSLTSSPVPEPATLGLVAVGGLGLSLLKRRKVL